MVPCGVVSTRRDETISNPEGDPDPPEISKLPPEKTKPRDARNAGGF
jgi:hypothetical protein